MKKVFNILVLLLLYVSTQGQQPVNRSSLTKVADVLAQQPALEQARVLEAMNELGNFSAEDIANLLLTLKPQGSDNASVEYAANSYAFYVMQPGKEDQRMVYSNGLILALDKLTDKDNKAFVLQLMRQASKNEAIVAIVPYLQDDFLYDKAVLALNGIRTKEAATSLSVALKEVKSENKAMAIVTALGDLQSKVDEEAIIGTLTKYTSENYQFAAYTALSKIAGSQSAPFFLQKLKDVNYQFDSSNIAGLTLIYAHNLLKEGNPNLASSVANVLHKEAQKRSVASLQAGAIQLLAEIDPAKVKKLLMKGALSTNALYRKTALELLQTRVTPADLKKLIATLSKVSPDIQESIFEFLASNGSASHISTLESHVDAISDSKAKIAGIDAIFALSKGENSLYLIEEIEKADDSVVKGIVALLLSSKNGQIIDEINRALPHEDRKTQVVLLGVLAQRSNPKSSSVLLPLLTIDDTALHAAALGALPNVVNSDDFDPIVNLLKSCSNVDAPYLQRSLVAILKASPDKDEKIKKLIALGVSPSEDSSFAKFFPVFAGVGGAASLTTVTSYLTNSSLSEIAIRELANWSNTEVLHTLIKLARTKHSDELFGILFNGLVRQINADKSTAEQKTLYLKDAFSIAQTTEQKQHVLGSLQAVGTYQAMIFAAKYMGDMKLKNAATNTAMNIAMDNKAFTGDDVRQILENAIGNLGGSESSYLKEAIIRHLSEMPQEKGFVSLFNGVDLNGWQGLVENPLKRASMPAKEREQKQRLADVEMHRNWQVLNGELVFNGEGDNIATIKQYGDFELLVDWKLDPNGKEPDAGIYLRGTPQVQIWDISRTNVGAQVGSGGLYNNVKGPKDPLEVADNALGEWNTFKIRMVGEMVSVWLNGLLVVDSVALENYWDRNQSIFPQEQIELQAHGSRVWYRDIFIKELARKEIYTLNDDEKAKGFEVLFDGENLDKWTESTAYEITPEGYLRANPDAKSGKNLYTKKEFSDFIYRFDFKLTTGANNGVGIRTPLEGDAAYVGSEIQILDNDAAIYENLQDYQYHGSVYGVIPAKRLAMKAIGEWNREEIRVEGSKIRVTLNDVVILDGDLADAAKNGTLDNKPHPGLLRSKGHIGFLGHGSEVFFRNIRIKAL